MRAVAQTPWAIAKTGTETPTIFEALCEAAAQQVQDFKPHAVGLRRARCCPSTLGRDHDQHGDAPPVLEALGEAAAQQVQDFKPHAAGLRRARRGTKLWAMAMTGTGTPEVFEAL